jgi:hypothetical protein
MAFGNISKDEISELINRLSILNTWSFACIIVYRIFLLAFIFS